MGAPGIKVYRNFSLFVPSRPESIIIIMSFIQEFLQQTVYLGMPDESTLANEGTVTPNPHFNASGDVGILDKAIKVKGVDENTIIDVLVKRSNEQRQMIKEA